MQKNLPPQNSKGLAQSPKSPAKPRTIVSFKSPPKKPRKRNWLVGLGASILILSSAGLIAGGAWLSIQLIIDPNALIWLNRFLPAWTRIPLVAKDSLQTLEQIGAGVTERGLFLGESIPLNSQGTEILLPIIKKISSCETNCQQIVELRVYQAQREGQYYQLISQTIPVGPDDVQIVPIPENPEEFASAPHTPRQLPLTNLSQFEGKVPAPGVWLLLTGRLVQGDAPILYGQVLHYNPATLHLGVLASWHSPSGQIPSWQEVTGGKLPELVVNQTLGLEPKFTIYQVKSRNFLPDPTDLEEIFLNERTMDNSTYLRALALANNGLWSPAEGLLKSIKKLPPKAQAQRDVIHWHAKISQAQVKQSWASPSQQVLVNLIDGRWREALEIFQSLEASGRSEISSSLKSDSGRLWRRVEAALRVKLGVADAEAWGALILAAQEGRPRAIAWLKQRYNQAALVKVASKKGLAVPNQQARIEGLLDLLDGALVEQASASNHLSQILAVANPVKAIASDWLALDSTLPTKEEAEIWYQVQVTAFNDGHNWQKPPFSTISSLSKEEQIQYLSKLLGLDTDLHLKIAVWNASGQQQSVSATIKGIRAKNGQIEFLAAGEKPIDLPNVRPLAYSEAALQWITPELISLADLNQVQPDLGKVLLVSLWRELQKVGQAPGGKVPSSAEILSSIGHWMVQPVELIAKNQQAAVLHLYRDPVSGFTQSAPEQNSPRRTIIFDQTGAIVYSELTKDKGRSLAAIALLGDGDLPWLVVASDRTYNFLRWSEQHRRFE
jgi:hypothetical protein